MKAGERVAVLSGAGGSILFTRVNVEPAKARIAGENVRIAAEGADADTESIDAPAGEADKRSRMGTGQPS